MKNPFIYSYAGNKRNEIEEIYKHLNFNNIDTIVETNSGSCSMSYYIAKMNPNKYKYILNDNDNMLFKLYNILKNVDESNELNNNVNNLVNQFNELKTDDERRTFWKNNISNKLNNIVEYVFYNKYKVLGRMCPQLKRCKQLTQCDVNKSAIVDFFRSENIEFTNINDIEVIEKYKDKKHYLYLIDPPYLQTYNSFYANKDMNIYEYLNKNPIKKMKAKIYIILEVNWIIDLLFKNNNVLLRQNKTYEISKKKTTHYVISNQKSIL